MAFQTLKKNIVYKIFKDKFLKYNVELDLLELDKYALYLEDDRLDFNIEKYDFALCWWKKFIQSEYLY